MADKWAKGCYFKHGQPSSPTSEYDEVGQNLYTSSSTNPVVNWTMVSLSWYDEKSYYTFADQTCLTGKMCGHYTQVLSIIFNQLSFTFNYWIIGMIDDVSKS